MKKVIHFIDRYAFVLSFGMFVHMAELSTYLCFYQGTQTNHHCKCFGIEYINGKRVIK